MNKQNVANPYNAILFSLKHEGNSHSSFHKLQRGWLSKALHEVKCQLLSDEYCMILLKWETGVTHFSKVHIMPLCFYGRPALVCILANQKKSLSWKKWNQHSPFFCNSHCRGRTQWAVRGPPPTCFPGSTLGISASSRQSCGLCVWASVLSLHLFCASLSKMGAGVTASSLYTILASDRFRRNALLSDIRGNLYLGLAQLTETESRMVSTQGWGRRGGEILLNWDKVLVLQNGKSSGGGRWRCCAW